MFWRSSQDRCSRASSSSPLTGHGVLDLTQPESSKDPRPLHCSGSWPVQVSLLPAVSGCCAGTHLTRTQLSFPGLLWLCRAVAHCLSGQVGTPLLVWSLAAQTLSPGLG